MLTKIQKWGNSQGVRISKETLRKASLKENDFVEIVSCDDGCILIKSNKRKHIPLKERIRDYNGNYEVHEWNIGENIGKEVF